MKSRLLFMILLSINMMLATAKAEPLSLPQTTRPDMTTNFPDNDPRWLMIDSLSNQGLPQSALKLVNEIMQQSQKESNYAEYLKANLYELKLRALYEEDYLKNYIAEREKMVTAMPSPANRIIYSILADLYWQYYSQNRWQILDRTGIQDAASIDISTWDVHQFVRKVSAYYSASLADAELLKSVSLKKYDIILETSEGSKTYRPTLFDFLAHRAIDFYWNEESSITRPVHNFVMNDADLLALSDVFVHYRVPAADTLSFDYRALLLFQQLIAFHSADNSPEALVNIDLERLDYVYNKINHPKKDSLYYHTLMMLEKQYSGKPVSAAVMEKIANWFYVRPATPVRISKIETTSSKTDIVKAREWCLKVVNSFPETKAAQNCKALLKSIEQHSVEFKTNAEVIPDKEFPILLQYKNVNKLWLRLIKTEYLLNRQYYSDQNENLKKFLAVTPFKSWTVTLPDAGDYREHSAEYIMPSVPTGNYVLLISDRESFSIKDTVLAYGTFQVSNLTYLSRSAPDGSGLVYVLDRTNGQPVSGVEVQSFTMNYAYKSRSYNRVNSEKYITGSDGSFTIKAVGPKGNANLSFEFRYKKDELIAENYYALYNRRNDFDKSEKIRTSFFTDRAIYRPGQPVYFKGIIVRSADQANSIVTGLSSSVSLYDVNGQKISSVNVTSGEYGSFSGSFVLPSAGLTGQMRIGNETGSVGFSVEEYKRPRFEVTFKPIDSSFRLNEIIHLSGVAKTYAEVPVSDAQVSYRVVRTASFPFFRYGYFMWPPLNIPEAEIANGILTTNSEGTFNITFTAEPDPSEYGDKNPLYSFIVYVDVTDINGETQSGNTSVNVSNKALLLESDIASEINASQWAPVKVKATNLSGKPVPVSIKAELYQLKEKELLVPRKWDEPDTALYSREDFTKRLPCYPFMKDTEAAVKDKLVFSQIINTATDSILKIKDLDIEPGRYLLILSAVDAFGTPVSVEKPVVIYDPESRKIPEPAHLWFTLINPKPMQGEKLKILTGSAVQGRLLMEIQSAGELLKHQWYDLSKQQLIEFALPEGLTGQVTLMANLVYGNSNFSEQIEFAVPDKSKLLSYTFETFRSPLLPGSSEKWKIKITDSEGKPLQAELMAGMYDASLDAFVKHGWDFQLFQPWHGTYNWELQQAFNFVGSLQASSDRYISLYPEIQEYDKLNWFGYNSFNNRFGGGIKSLSAKGQLYKENDSRALVQEEVFSIVSDDAKVIEASAVPEAPAKAEVQIRRNLQETAFFYPHLTTNKAGEVWVEFTVPEALTRWNFMGLAHTVNLQNGQFNKQVVTRKELMVTPNLPRYFREGDHIVIQAKVSNLASNPVQGEAQLLLMDAMTMEPINSQFKNAESSKPFSLPVNGNGTLSWQIEIPESMDAVMVRITAIAGNHSDGEEVLLPILTNRMMVTETLPLPVNGNTRKTFKLDQLANGTGSKTLKNYRLTLEYTSNPAWYALQALPWLESNEKENSDQLFNRFYANSLAAHVANSSPKIRSVFESWKNKTPDALLSNLEKNEELKALFIEETPWLMDAKNESEQKQKLALMFDLNRIASQREAALYKLQQSQSANGGWPWFQGMPESRYITQWIVTGMGKLHYIKVNNLTTDNDSRQMVQKAVNYLSERIVDDYQRILKESKEPDKDHLGYEHIQFLYALSYLDGVVQLPEKANPAIAYFSNQARKYWPTRNLYAQSMIALWAGRNGDKQTCGSIIASLRERAIVSPEMGTWWRDNRRGYFWYQAPVETQALIIELFEELGNNKAEVDQMKTWLLKQKQTQSWETTTGTADAVYALLLRGSDWLQTDPSVVITVGNITVDPSKDKDIQTDAGTGYFKTSWSKTEITSSMGNVTVSKSTEGPAWGALYYQYFENLDKIKAADSPLKIAKQLYIRENTPSGPRLTAITESHPLEVGQQLTVRVEITVDRDLEYVHLKDMRAAAFEPVNTLSGYQWKGGLGYYESTRDASTNFFFYYLPKGTHVFEYPLVVSQKGEFSNGISTIQCMYAPEFTAHSEGIRVTVE